jgi:uncharacterized protein YkwD
MPFEQGNRQMDQARARAGTRRVRAALTRVVAVTAVAATALAAPVGPLAAPTAGAATAALGLPALQSLYAQDLLARVNAERAARNSAAQPIPPLAVDLGLAAAAQAWSARMAATGQIMDPPLANCAVNSSPTQVCELAANTGNSGNGTWPGDGSDGMESDYMASSGHRQNMLNAGYDTVGIGVTCSGGQAWTVEVFGFAYGNLGPAVSRQSAQNAIEGVPVPAGPSVAGTRTGVPVYCPGQTDGPNGQSTATGGQVPYPYAVPPVPGEPTGATADPAVGIATDGRTGYWVARSDGSLTAHGTAALFGSMADVPLHAPVRHIVATHDGGGYWLVAADGGTFAFGDATYYGSMGAQVLNAPVVDMAPSSHGHGYWLVASDGGIFAFGDAGFAGSMGGVPLNAPIVGMAPTADGHGYWLVASDGGIFAFGDAAFCGSAGALHLNAAIVGMAPTADGHGYWLVASDGGVFAFGDASFQGSAGTLQLQAPIAGMATDPSTGGYWMVANDGGVFAFGAPFEGAG